MAPGINWVALQRMGLTVLLLFKPFFFRHLLSRFLAWQKDQYKATRRISRTELKEGDLLFFNTRGGVSHVGIYLQNNKFVHASVSGVMISDMFEPLLCKTFYLCRQGDKHG
jgi:hypothetical protein